MKDMLSKLLIISILSSKIREKDEKIEPVVSHFSENCPYLPWKRLEIYDQSTNKSIGYIKKLSK